MLLIEAYVVKKKHTLFKRIIGTLRACVEALQRTRETSPCQTTRQQLLAVEQIT